jgi:hypothetical protein
MGGVDVGEFARGDIALEDLSMGIFGMELLHWKVAVPAVERELSDLFPEDSSCRAPFKEYLFS